MTMSTKGPYFEGKGGDLYGDPAWKVTIDLKSRMYSDELSVVKSPKGAGSLVTYEAKLLSAERPFISGGTFLPFKVKEVSGLEVSEKDVVVKVVGNDLIWFSGKREFKNGDSLKIKFTALSD